MQAPFGGSFGDVFPLENKGPVITYGARGGDGGYKMLEVLAIL